MSIKKTIPFTKQSKIFDNRTYRSRVKGDDLRGFSVTVKETNLFIQAEKDLSQEVLDIVLDARHIIEDYIISREEFKTSLIPIEDDPFAPAVIRAMIVDSARVGVGPMAGVAGAIAEYVARGLIDVSEEGVDAISSVIVENGGDIFMVSEGHRVIALHIPPSMTHTRREMEVVVSESGGLGIEISDASQGIGISSSSSSFGHSMSLGLCDLTTVVAESGALSDAAATGLGNSVRDEKDIEGALDNIIAIPGVQGGLVVMGGKIGIKGDIRLTALDN